jgi:hypothetical protein
MKRFALLISLTLIFILAACASSEEVSTELAPPTAESVSTPLPTPTDDPALTPTLFPSAANGELTRVDEQGAVIVQVTPLNLGLPADTLEFDILLNTHSIDLSMDLAVLSTLTAGTNGSIQPVSWEGPRGGHHVQGKLTFPAMQDGRSILEGASKLTLIITGVDAPSRIFEWELK